MLDADNVSKLIIDYRDSAAITQIEAYMKAYCRRTGITSIENWNYYMAFNFFRLAGISFGIKGRLRDGTAASKHARASADAAEPLAQFGLNQI